VVLRRYSRARTRRKGRTRASAVRVAGAYDEEKEEEKGASTSIS